MKIGILQTGQAPDALRADAGDYPDMFQRLLAGRGFLFRTWHVEAMQFPQTVHDADGWLITGSKHGAYESHPFIKPLEAFIRDAWAEKVPMVGICFGHQIIAQAMGGTVQRHVGGWAVGPQSYDFDGEMLTLNAWHQDQVVKKPKEARILASNAVCTNAAFVYGDRMLTVQAHPEFSTDFVDGLMRTRGPGVVPDVLMADARKRMDEPIASTAIADRIADLFHKARPAPSV